MAVKQNKVAIVVIHGMGEQRPMETLRGFVDAAWVCDPDIVDPAENQTYSKPDDISGGFELRRITTKASGRIGARCDFFEYYWAHQMTGNRPSSMFHWLRRLLMRGRETVPDRLLAHWRFGLALIRGLGAAASLAAVATLGLLLLILSGALILRPDETKSLFLVLAAIVAVVAALGVLLWQLLPTLVSFVGDAARYFTPLPDNIAARNAIRQGGVDLIQKLHQRGYQRIIVAAHSLGTVVGYDILNHAWGQIPSEEMESLHSQAAVQAALRALEKAAAALERAEESEMPALRRNFRDAQRAYADALGHAAPEAWPAWRVTDFVTMGSPLSKADVLIAYQQSEWAKLKERREAPTSPPMPDEERPDGFCYRRPSSAILVPHHAAVFGPTVWTNIFFENEAVYKGDVVAGEIAPHLGRGVLDIRIRRGKPLIRHTHYWWKPKERAPWIRALQAALNLARRDETSLWKGIDERPVVHAEEIGRAGGGAGLAGGQQG